MKTMFNVTLCAVAVLAMQATLRAQQVGGQPQVGGQQAGGQAGVRTAGAAGGANRMDDHIASCLILGNQNEIAASKLAEQQAKHSEVKSFAKEMEREHTQYIQQLAKFASQDFQNRDLNRRSDASGSESRTTGTEATTRPAGTAAGTPAATPAGTAGTAGTVAGTTAGATAGAGGDPCAVQLQMKQELADECLSSVRKELSSRQGSEFDEAYIGLQIGEHMRMIDELKVAERHASPQFQSILREGRESAQKHLEHAKQIKKTLASNSSEKSEKSSDK